MSEPGKMLALFGQPVAQSLSPEIFSYLAKKTGQPLQYRLCEVTQFERLARLLVELRHLPLLDGFNVTHPFKEQVFSLFGSLGELSVEAQVVGAVNWAFRKDASWYGFNTDVMGMRHELDSLGTHPGFRARIYGAGGAARALAYVLGEKKWAQVQVVSRDGQRARTLRQKIETQFPQTRYLDESLKELRSPLPVDLIFNATPYGMSGRAQGQYDDLIADFQKHLEVSPQGQVWDLNYRPFAQSFYQLACDAGVPAWEGMGLLVAQALAAYAMLYPELQPVENLHSALVQHLRAHLQKLEPGAGF